MNIHTIMASEQRVHKLMIMLQGAIDEASRLETRLDAYCSLLKVYLSLINNFIYTFFNLKVKTKLITIILECAR